MNGPTIACQVSYRLPNVSVGGSVLLVMDPCWCIHALRFLSWRFWKGSLESGSSSFGCFVWDCNVVKSC